MSRLPDDVPRALLLLESWVERLEAAQSGQTELLERTLAELRQDIRELIEEVAGTYTTPGHRRRIEVVENWQRRLLWILSALGTTLGVIGGWIMRGVTGGD